MQYANYAACIPPLPPPCAAVAEQKKSQKKSFAGKLCLSNRVRNLWDIWIQRNGQPRKGGSLLSFKKKIEQLAPAVQKP